MRHDWFDGGRVSRPAEFATLATLDLDGLADQLASASVAMRQGEPRLPPGLYRLGEIPLPGDDWTQAAASCRRLGERLCQIGGPELMLRVYDHAVDRHGYDGIRGVSPQWNGVGGWAN